MLKRLSRDLLTSDSGATTIEYALVASFVSIAILIPAIEIGDTLQGFFQQLLKGFSG